MQNLVTSNFEVFPPTILPPDQLPSYAAVAVTSNQATVSVPKRVYLTQQETPFTLVRNGVQRNNNESCLPITTCNRFKILVEDEEEDHETRLIGDSIVREQLHEFCGRARNTRRFCMSGGRLDVITSACKGQQICSILTLL